MVTRTTFGRAPSAQDRGAVARQTKDKVTNALNECRCGRRVIGKPGVSSRVLLRSPKRKSSRDGRDCESLASRRLPQPLIKAYEAIHRRLTTGPDEGCRELQ